MSSLDAIAAHIPLPFGPRAVLVVPREARPNYRDVVVVADALPEILAITCLSSGVTPPWVPLLRRDFGGVTWETQYWRTVQAEAALDGFRRTPAGPWDEPQVTDAHVSFFARVRRGKPLTDDGWLERQRAALADNDPLGVVALKAFGEADASLDHAMDLAGAGQYAAAALEARAAFGRSIDGVLARAGEVGPHNTPRSARLRGASTTSPTWDEYWSVETLDGFSVDPPGWIRRTVLRCRDLMATVDVAPGHVVR